MKKIRILSVLLIVSMIAFLTGCGGGGGSSAPVEKDVTGITSTLSNYMAALRANDAAAAARYLASTAASPTSTGDAVRTLIVQDFGSSITDHDDNQSWNFYVYPQDIIQPSNEIAFVTARHTLHSGEVLIIRFSMIKEGGIWVIADMELVSSSSSPHSPGLGSFVTASYFPIIPDGEHFYALENSDGTILDEVSLYAFRSSTKINVNGIDFYNLSDTMVNMAAATVSRRAIRNAGRSIRQSTVEDFFDQDVYLGYSNGALYMYIPDEDPDRDYVELFMKANYSFNSTDTFQRRYYDGETEIIATVTLNIGSPLPFVTPLKTYQAVKIIETMEWKEPSTGVTKTSEVALYFAENVGIVGEDGWWYLDDSATNVFLKARLIVRKLGNEKEANDPYISAPTNGNLGTFDIGESVNITFVAQGGDATSRKFELGTGGLPYNLNLNASTGVLSGTIDSSAASADDMTYNFQVKVEDKYGRSSSKAYSMVVKSSSGGTTLPSIVFYPPFVSPENVVSPKDWAILIENEPIDWSEFADYYSVSFENVSPPSAYSAAGGTENNLIGIGSYPHAGDYYGQTCLWGIGVSGTTVSFELVIERLDDNQIFRSGVLSYTSGTSGM